jgi:hypothetical protein
MGNGYSACNTCTATEAPQTPGNLDERVDRAAHDIQPTDTGHLLYARFQHYDLRGRGYLSQDVKAMVRSVDFKLDSAVLSQLPPHQRKQMLELQQERQNPHERKGATVLGSKQDTFVSNYVAGLMHIFARYDRNTDGALYFHEFRLLWEYLQPESDKASRSSSVSAAGRELIARPAKSPSQTVPPRDYPQRTRSSPEKKNKSPKMSPEEQKSPQKSPGNPRVAVRRAVGPANAYGASLVQLAALHSDGLLTSDELLVAKVRPRCFDSLNAPCVGHEGRYL